MLLKNKCTHRHISDDELLAAVNEATGIDELCDRLRVDPCEKCKARLERRWERLLNRSTGLLAMVDPAA
ncbi:MAG: hypothetical protein ACOX8S_11685 [Christensenellales bacterium]|jgi:hypothetical protein